MLLHLVDSDPTSNSTMIFDLLSYRRLAYITPLVVRKGLNNEREGDRSERPFMFSLTFVDRLHIRA